MKNKLRSFGFRLWLYFVLFTAIIFSVLWLLQTVFLQSFYDEMIIHNTKAAAEEMIRHSTDEDFEEWIDELSRKNSLLVYMTDQDGKLLYSSDEFTGMRKKNMSSDSAPSGKRNEKRGMSLRSLPEEYASFLESLQASETGRVEIRMENYYVFGAYIDEADSEEKTVLYVGATMDAVGASVTIIRMQLLWVTLLSVLIGLVLSWFIAKRFSSPVDRLSVKARHLGEKDYEPGGKKSFCVELDELSETLDRTNENIAAARVFQMELLANVSHDLRTPITMIKGYAEMIRDLSWDDEEQCAKDVAVIVREADRLTALVNEIMEYSELKTENRTEEHFSLNLSLLCEQTAASFETLKKPDGILVEKEIAPDLIVSGNSGRLQRALYNLMDNAARHTGDSRRIRVSLAARDQSAVLTVTDFGPGIPPEELPYIWDRYYTTRMRKGKGVSGLGLAIVRQITERHGGTCSARCEPAGGSSFLLQLPLSTQPPRQ